MKNILKPTICIVLTIALTVALTASLGSILDPPESSYALDAIDAFHCLPENSQDVIVYGSSHAWKDCDTRVMQDHWGLAAYNYGCNWQAINTTLLFLEDSFRTQSPKVVCVETYKAHYILQDTDMDGQIYYTKKIPYSQGKLDYLKQCFGSDPTRYLSYYLPLTMFHDNWAEISAENFVRPAPEAFLKTAGYMEHQGDLVEPCQAPDYENFPQNALPTESVKILDRMVELCKENGAQLIFFTAPLSYEYCYGDAMAEYAREKGVPYLNLFEHTEEMGLDWETDLRDTGHLNDHGAGKVADYLGRYIKENYDL